MPQPGMGELPFFTLVRGSTQIKHIQAARYWLRGAAPDREAMASAARLTRLY